MTTTSQKIAVVTGGSRGLGRTTAFRLANSGVGVVLTCRSARPADVQVGNDDTPAGWHLADPIQSVEIIAVAHLCQFGGTVAQVAARWVVNTGTGIAKG
ncbi:hypothetical protein GCM10009555_098200 [Acrocarpospora macrocephala]|uniref:Short-chain dehydrogenase n=1 Tax=Acrocarpospora macrocephala TaxID=150177 RepID=A0A5M3WXE2_9ACTN|nr:SDR family NAD(P)-dependent oxidoreductase [Acrocarpospora macrocephala]GES12599.1 hypothetical protein Amac_061960 [Acrocarpospora macrocephala]